MNVDAAFFNRRRGRGVTVRLVIEWIRAFYVEKFEIVLNRASFAVHADGEHLRPVGLGGGHPNLVAPNHRRRPALVVNSRLPNDVLLFAPGHGEAGRVGVTIFMRPAVLRPILAGKNGGGQSRGDQENGGAHGWPRREKRQVHVVYRINDRPTRGSCRWTTPTCGRRTSRPLSFRASPRRRGRLCPLDRVGSCLRCNGRSSGFVGCRPR
jgi:hypothetical protein